MVKKRQRWYRELAQSRTNVAYPVVISGHCLVDKMIPLNIEEEAVEAAIRNGSLVPEKCEEPDKLVFVSRKGARDEPLVVVTCFRSTHIKVLTVYLEE